MIDLKRRTALRAPTAVAAATNCPRYGNILALKNALRRILGFARFHEQDVSIGLVRRALSGLS